MKEIGFLRKTETQKRLEHDQVLSSLDWANQTVS